MNGARGGPTRTILREPGQRRLTQRQALNHRSTTIRSRDRLTTLAQCGCSAILVEPAEVRAQSCAVLVGTSASAAFGLLKIPKASGWALVERQDGTRLDPVIVDGRTGQHRIYRFTQEVISNFMSEFITDVRLGNAYDVQKRVAIAHLKRSRVRPAVPHAEIGIYLYRASEIPELKVA